MADSTYQPGIYRKQGGNELVVASGARVTVEAGGIVDASAAGSGGLLLPVNQQTGFIPMPLFGWRKITTNNFGAIAVASGNGGQLATDTTPILSRINAATDKKARISWVATDVSEIQYDLAYPPDLDDTAALTINLLVYKDANTDTGAVLGVGFFEGVGDTNAGGNTAAITETAAAQKTVVIAAGDVGAYPKGAAVTIIPGTHGNDAIYLLAAWCTYVRKQ